MRENRLVTRLKNLFYGLIDKYKLESYKNLLKHSFWAIFGSILSRGIMLISSVVLARVLSQNDYGELGIVRSTINMFAIFAGFGIGNTMSRYISLNKKDNIIEARRIFDISFSFTLLLAILISASVFIFSRQIAEWSFNNVELYKELQISAFLLFFATINGAYHGSLAGFQDFKTIAKNSFYSSCFQAIFAILGGYYFGTIGAIFGFGVGYVVLFFLHGKSIKRNFGGVLRKVSIKDIIRTDKSFIWMFSIPAALSSFLVTPVFWWSKSYLIRSTSFIQMALYDVADQWRIIVLFIPSALISIVLPSLTVDRKNFQNTLTFNIKVNLLATIIILIPLTILSKYILELYGEEYVNIELFIVLTSSAIFTSMGSVFGSAIASLGIMWKGLIFNLFWAIYMIVFTILFVHNLNMGALGVAYAVLLSYIIHSSAQFIFLKIYIKKRVI